MCSEREGSSHLETSAAASSPSPSSVLSTSASVASSSAASALAASRATPVGGLWTMVGGALAVHIDRLVIFGGVGGGFMPSGKIVVGAFPGGVVLTVTGAAGVRVLCVCRSIELVSAVAKEGDPLCVRVSIVGWGGGVDVEKGDCCTLFYDLERNDLHSPDNSVQDILGGEMGVRGIVVFFDKIFERVGCVGHDRGHEGGGYFRDRGIIIVEEGVFEGHYVIGDEATFGQNEESSFWGCPAVPEKELTLLEASYSPNVVGGDRPVFGVLGSIYVGNDYVEVGSIERVAEHISECDNFGRVDIAVVGWREGDDTWALLLVPELDGGRIEVGTNSLVAMTLDFRETSFRSRYELVFCGWGEVLHRG